MNRYGYGVLAIAEMRRTRNGLLWPDMAGNELTHTTKSSGYRSEFISVRQRMSPMESYMR